MKFKVRIFAIFIIAMFSIQSTISFGDDSLETVQLTLAITSADEINLTAVKQVEKGINSFEAIGQLVVMEAKKTGSLKFVLLAGLFAGFYLASKYFGLIFVLASLPIILMGKDTTKNLAIYLAMVIAMGFQWYLWNYLHTSDPLFPSLTNFFSYPDTI